MKLKPVMASYSGEAFSAMKRFLTDDILAVVASVAHSPLHRTEIAGDVLAELVAMHVLREQDGLVTLSTAVFLRDDMERIVSTVAPLAQELSRDILECGAAFRNASPEVTIFLGGIIALVQGLGMTLRQRNIGADWKNYTGKYARSKVDFDEICDAQDAIGPDCLNKTVLQGERYTAVFIGPGGNDFCSLTDAMYASDASQRYAGDLNRYLVDAYAMLARGEIQHESLRAAASAANLFRQGKLRTAVITNETIHRYESAIQAIIDVASSYYVGKLDVLDELLRSTASGKQGVPPANMMMHLWRYYRRAIAKELYANGFLTDTIPEEGTLTVFYENNVELIRQFLM